jgi:hypothetical protein
LREIGREERNIELGDDGERGNRELWGMKETYHIKEYTHVHVGGVGERHWQVKDLNELEPTTSTILEQRLNHSTTGDLNI